MPESTTKSLKASPLLRSRGWKESVGARLLLASSAWDAAPEGTVHVITKSRDEGTNWRTHFQRIIKRAGVVQIRCSRQPKNFSRLAAP